MTFSITFANITHKNYKVMATIQSLSISQLHNEESFAFLQLVQTETQYLTDELTKPAVEQFKTNLADYDVALKDSATVPSASLVSERDAKRDFACNGLWRVANVTAAYHPDPDVRSVWQSILAILDKYGNPANLPQTEESGVIYNALQDLRALDADSRQVADADVWIDALGNAEELYLSAVQTRTAEEAARTNGIVKQTRTAAEASYRALVALVNALIGVNGIEAYETFVSHLNVLIDRQKTVLKTRATNAAKKSEGDSSSEATEDEATEGEA